MILWFGVMDFLCFYGPQPWAWAVVIVELEINNLYSIRMIFLTQIIWDL